MSATFQPGFYRITSRFGTIVRWCEVDETMQCRSPWIAAYLTREQAGAPEEAEFIVPLTGFQHLNSTRIETGAGDAA